MTIRVSVFDDVQAQSLEVRQLTVEDLAALIGNTQAPDKQRLPLLKLAYFGDWRTSKGSLRHDRNMHFISGVEMDYDGEEVSFEDAVAIAEKQPLNCVIYTSPSHRPERPRWRLIAPCSQELPAKDRRRLVERINGAYGGIFSSESWTLSQAFYFGRDARNPNFDIEVVEGEPVDQLDELDLIARPKAQIVLNGNGQSFEGTTAGLVETELAELIRTGAHYHEPTLRLATIRARRGDDQSEVVDDIENLFDEVPPEKQDRERWKARRNDVHRCVADMFLNAAREAEEREARLAEELAAREAHWAPALPKPDDHSWPDRGKANGSGGSPALREWDAGEADYAHIPPRGWLLGNTFCRGFVSGLISEGAGGKTAIRLLQLLSVATGRKLTHEHVFVRGRALLIILDDDRKEIMRRLRAAMLHHAIDPSELKGWLFVVSIEGFTGARLAEIGIAGRFQVGALKDQIEELIDRRNIDLMCIDPLKKAHSVPENDNSAMDIVITVMSDIANFKDVAVDAPYHANKGTAEPGDVNRGRGASSYKDGGRLIQTLSPMSKEDAERMGVTDEKERRLLRRIDDAKINLAPPGETIWFKLVDVEIGNRTETYPRGDHVQTVEIWQPPDLWSGISTDLAITILYEIDKGNSDGQPYSNHHNAKERAAWAVVQKYLPTRTDHQAREIVNAWIKSGALEIREVRNPKTRKDVEGLKLNPAHLPGNEWC